MIQIAIGRKAKKKTKVTIKHQAMLKPKLTKNTREVRRGIEQRGKVVRHKKVVELDLQKKKLTNQE